MEHTFSGLNIIDAVPTTDLAVSGIQIVENSFGSNAFRGTLHNNTTETLDDPAVWVFGLTAAGRPLAGAEDSSALSISSFGTVSFETGGFQAAAEDITDFVAYPFARLP
jgi:hypothetical protein